MLDAGTWWLFVGSVGAGALLVELAERFGARAERRSTLERAALVVLVGVAAITLVATCAIAAWGPLGTTSTRVALAAAALAGAVASVAGLSRRRAHAIHADPRPVEAWRPLHVVLAALLVVSAAFAALYTSTMPVHTFDAVYHFAYKGKLLAHEGFGGASWTDLGGPVGRIITHPDYPPGVPAMHAVVGAARSGFSEDATRPMMGVLALATGALLFAALRAYGRLPALLGAIGWLGLPLLYYSRLPRSPFHWANDESRFLETFAFSARDAGLAVLGLLWGAERAHRDFPHLRPFRMPDGWVLDGAADLPLAALLFGAVWCLARVVRGEGRADRVLAGVLLAGAALAKNEGLALGALTLVLFAVATAYAHGARAVLRLAPAAIVFAAGAAVWLVLRASIPSIDENYPRAILRVFRGAAQGELGPFDRSPTSPSEALARVPVVALGMFRAFVDVLRWNLTWIVFAVGVVLWLARARALVRHPIAAPMALVLATLVLYSVILVVTPWDLPTLYNTAIPDRLLLHVTPVALWVAFAAWDRERGAEPRVRP